jgi:hypothetical protein
MLREPVRNTTSPVVQPVFGTTEPIGWPSLRLDRRCTAAFSTNHMKNTPDRPTSCSDRQCHRLMQQTLKAVRASAGEPIWLIIFGTAAALFGAMLFICR